MAKNYRTSGGAGVAHTGYAKRPKRRYYGMRLTEIAGPRISPDIAAVEIVEADGVRVKIFQEDRIIREGRAIRAGRVIPPVETGHMVEAVMHAAADEGLTLSKDGRIAGRVSSELIAKAKAKTGITSDTELIEFALANLAVEDKFAEAFHAVRGTVDPDLDFGF